MFTTYWFWGPLTGTIPPKIAMQKGPQYLDSPFRTVPKLSKILGHPYLVGGVNPSEKYARQIGSFPQGSGWKLKKNKNNQEDKYIHP